MSTGFLGRLLLVPAQHDSLRRKLSVKNRHGWRPLSQDDMYKDVHVILLSSISTVCAANCQLNDAMDGVIHTGSHAP